MDIGHNTINALLERMQDHGADYVTSYGEPGYWSSGTTGVLLGYYWCRCENGPESDDERSKLHSLDYHYPRLFAALEEQGIACEWSDEWYADHENGKAYRTTADSYGWQSSIMWTDHGEILTPDDDLDAWCEVVANDAGRCLPRVVWSRTDLAAAGWTEYAGQLESGWHPGMDADPAAVMEEIREEIGDDVDVVFLLDDTSQFYVTFSAWTRDSNYDPDTDN